jgi:uncharacterized protein
MRHCCWDDLRLGQTRPHILFCSTVLRYGLTMSTTDPILTRLRNALTELYGERIERVVLFGSRARGDATADSDYDVAVFLRDLPNRWAEVSRIIEIEHTIRDDTGADIHTLPFPAGSWRDRTPLMYEIRQDGLDL